MNFHDYFARAATSPQGKDGWRRIERMLDARPGDILAWRAAVPKMPRHPDTIAKALASPTDAGYKVRCHAAPRKGDKR